MKTMKTFVTMIVTAIFVTAFGLPANAGMLMDQYQAYTTQRQLDRELHTAIDFGDLIQVMQLVAEGADVNSSINTSYRSMSCLHRASYRGHYLIAKFLIENGADVNAMTTGRVRPIHYAAMQGHYDIVELLVENGADPNAFSRVAGGTSEMIVSWQERSRSDEITKSIIGSQTEVSAFSANH
jgi:ankyrin repeat protein